MEDEYNTPRAAREEEAGRTSALSLMRKGRLMLKDQTFHVEVR